MAAQAGGGFKTLLSMGFAKPCSPRTAARRFKVDLEEIGRCMRAAEAAKATSKTLQEKPRRRPGCPKKSLTVSNVLGFGAGSETDNVVATKGGNIVILDPESTSGERGDPIELDGENQDGQPRVEDPALEAEGGGKDGSAGGVTKMVLTNLWQNRMNLLRIRCGGSLMSTGSPKTSGEPLRRR
ncbi:unnamed protein product [Sphagnum troendelagicum]|uniref:Uncharacterized protein n=1 Tax=Sphagnum troendelagicum TaxID=128251 RepID=A0ABP0TMH7_9BRYO